jgi:enediyne biosynthesis protein E9
MQTLEADVLVIGSGFGAAAPALRLSRAGHRVVVVEKGPDIEPARDFRQTQDPRYLLTYLKSVSGPNLSMMYAEGLGGGSGFYDMISLRAPRRAFQQVDRDGSPLWPSGLDRAVLDPFYAVAEVMLKVRQLAPHEIPRTGLVFSLLLKNLGYSSDRSRYAVRGCIGCGYCVSGCVNGAKQSLHVNYLPQAVAAGATVKTGLHALRIRPLSAARADTRTPLAAQPFRYEVFGRRVEGPNEQVRIRARLVVLAGGTVGTAALLLRSRSELPALSRHVGRNITFTADTKVAGLLPEGLPDGDMFAGLSAAGMISYQFLESHGLTVSTGKPLPLHLLTGHRFRVAGDTRDPVYWGEAHVELMQRYRRRMMILIAHGLTPPCGRLTLDPSGRVRVALEPADILDADRPAATALLQDILHHNGCALLEAHPIGTDGRHRREPAFGTAHQVGSCRMADSPRRGVVDPGGEVFGYPGLYVSDGAAIPSSLAVSPSLTILANAERIAAGILERVGLA